jgi:hypothetical protein
LIDVAQDQFAVFDRHQRRPPQKHIAHLLGPRGRSDQIEVDERDGH